MGLYQLHWFHIDSFGEVNKNSNVPEENIDEGLQMSSQNRLWQLQATTANANYIHYTFAVFLKDVLIDKNGIQFV
jgi:hypothetical protein